ncbi:PD-(D/E)XK motif protein [Azotobacter beijerinckii]|uniref:PD-(D/E)XK motif protein n=1 Tax=Azotobacter beijerinckii TaxID=170623 RepID=UPI00295450F5|nr:PD-(D/E)XK motif protein [Azotobacter beijerinckii]MDV7211286.1 PD-(D/E)XK motif protein [Azotobacter beijerinckii]
MRDPAPWDEISVPVTDFNVRQAPGSGAVPCFWGRNASGDCLFIVELQGDHAALFRKSVVAVKGIAVDLRAGDPGTQHLVLTLGRQVDRDLFEGLCQTLASAIEHTTDSPGALAVSLAHIGRWKAFLSGRRQHLSVEEVRGLFAEISFLLELIDREASATVAVEAWLGPERSHQDFIFGNTAVEIKSLSGTERSSVRISSEDQLESLNDALFLRIYRLSTLADAAGSSSLNDIVTTVQARLGEADAIEAFERKLVAHGYAPLPDYDSPRFVVSDVRSYRVGNGFPRLMRSQLPAGIASVAYDIRLESIAPHECDGAAIFGND